MRAVDLEKKKQERHVRKTQVRRRRNLQLAAVAVSVIFLAYGMTRLYNSSIFDIQEIEIAGNKEISNEQVLKISGVKTGQNLLRTPVKQVKKSVEQDPWAREVTVRKLLPQRLRIEVEERIPVGIVQFDEKKAVVDKDGFVTAVYKKTEKNRHSKLPRIEAPEQQVPPVGQRVKDELVIEAIQVLDGIEPAIRSRIRSISIGGAEELRIYLTNEIEILIGSPRELELKNRILAQIFHQYAQRKQLPVYIDIRAPRNPVTRDLPKM